MRKTIILAMLTFVPAAFGNSACPIDDKGKVLTPFGYELAEIKTSKNVDSYVFQPTKDNPNQTGSQIWEVTKDLQGRVIKVQSGGQKPSQLFLSFEIKRIEHDQKYEAFSKKRLDRPFSLPSAKSLSSAIVPAHESPVRFGAVVEMYHDNDGCKVGRIADRYYNQKDKNNFEHDVFNTNKCDSVRQLYKKFYKDVVACSKTADSHEKELALILNSSGNVGVTAGVGGGGGSPLRGIASINETEGASIPHKIAHDIFSKTTPQLQKEKDLCDIMSPIKDKSEKFVVPSLGGQTTHQ